MDISTLHNATLFHLPSTPVREHAGVTAIVVVFHLAVLTAWQMQPTHAVTKPHEMEISVAVMIAPAAVQINTLPPQRLPPKQLIEKTSVQSPRTDLPALPEEYAATSEVPQAVAAALSLPDEPAVTDIEPNYKASYLNNRLAYPLAARRAGIQGRVILNVEVLAEGGSGQVKVHQSSGYEVLDRAALESVQTWRFVPARRAGRNITEWFKIPIQFSLKDNAA